MAISSQTKVSKEVFLWYSVSGGRLYSGTGLHILHVLFYYCGTFYYADV